MGIPLKNTKHEAYARARASGEGVREAYRTAGYIADSGNAARIEALPEVRARIAEIAGPVVEKHRITLDDLYQQFLAQGTYDPGVFDDVKSPADLKTKVDEATRRLLVKGWKYDRKDRFILELVDKEKAMDRIARHMSFYNDTVKVDLGEFGSLLDKAVGAVGDEGSD